MAKQTKTLIIIFVFATLLTGVVQGTTVIEINQLIENSRAYNNKEVSIEGEAIGEVLERGDYAWVNINDGSNTLGVWFKIEDAKKILFFGDYKHKGDILKLVGTYHADCIEHGGDIDIHNVSFDIVQRGYSVKEIINPSKSVVSIVLSILTLIVAFVYFKVMKKS